MAKNMLRRAYKRDEQVQAATGLAMSPLSTLEKMMLSGILSAFVEGLFDAELKYLDIRGSAMSCASILGAYQIIQDTKSGMKSEREMETRLVKVNEYSDLKALVFREIARSASVLLAKFNSNSKVTRF